MENNNTKAEIITQVGDNPPVTWPMNSFTPWFMKRLMSHIAYYQADGFNDHHGVQLTAGTSGYVNHPSFPTSFASAYNVRNALNYTTTTYSSDSTFGTWVTNNLDVLSNSYVDTSVTENADNTTSFRIRKTYRNKSGAVLNLLESVLTSRINSSSQSNDSPSVVIDARDDIDITVQPNEYVTIEYNITLGKNITKAFKPYFLHTFCERNKFNSNSYKKRKNVLGNDIAEDIVVTNNYLAYSRPNSTYLSKEYGLMIGSDNSDLTGNEYCLRSEIPWESTQKGNNMYELSGDKIRIVRVFKNVTESPITIGEVAFYTVQSPGTSLDYNVQNNANNSLWMSFIQPLTTPIILQPGENVELTMKIVIP